MTSDVGNTSCESVDVFSEETRNENIARIQEKLRNNIQGYDLLLCLFYSSLNSLKVERCLKPFPPGFRDSDAVDQLRLIFSSLPNLKSILANTEQLSTQTIALLNWLFSRKKQPVFNLVDWNNFNFSNEVNITIQPNYVFEVVHSSQEMSIWNNLKVKHNASMAFHGSQVENFYSIVRFGLQQHFGNEKIQLYGQGTYLSTELSVSVIFAPFSKNWPKSLLGTNLSIIALCEVLDIKDKVKRKSLRNEVRALNQRNLGGTFPDKYLVVTDNEVMKVKYLLVYSKRENAIQSWVYQNMFLFLIILYFIFLCFLGSSRNISLAFTRFWNKYLRRYMSSL